MSGIAGLIRPGGTTDETELAGMLRAMVPRGPDRQAFACKDNAGFGQALLATTPEASCEIQPWTHRETGCVIVSDSRLDNRGQLLRDLGIARPADMVGDGELLHAAWQRWSDACADRLLGDFAFAIWDPRAQTLFCARDPMGVRPLLYYLRPGQLFAFASQTEALLALRQMPRDLDEGRIADVIVGGFEGYDKTSTFYRHIKRLPPGHTLLLHGGALQVRAYWSALSIPAPNTSLTENEWIEGLEQHLDAAVRSCLRGEIRAGSMLSGGLDSSAIVALANRQRAVAGLSSLPTFSAVSSTAGCAETAAATRMAALNPEHATLIDASKMPEMIAMVTAGWSGLGEPYDASVTLLDCQYIAAAEQGVRVMLDGIDADSLLSEGDYFGNLIQCGQFWKAFQRARKNAAFYGDDVRTSQILVQGISIALRDLIPDAMRHFRRSRRLRLQLRHSPLDPSFARRIRAIERYTSRPPVLPKNLSATGVLGPAMASAYLTSGIERYGRVASRRGIEARHPFLDRRLIEFCAWLPLALRLHDGYPKWALRRAMSDVLPDDIAWRRGKPHLGPEFNQAVFSKLTAGSAKTWNTAPLSAYTKTRAGKAARDNWDTAFDLQALQTWLLSNSKEL